MQAKTEIAEKLVNAGVERDMGFIDGSIHSRAGKAGWIKWAKKGVISQDIVEGKDRDRFRELADKSLLHIHEILMLGEQLPEGESFRALCEEFGEINERELEEMVQILERAGVVELMR